jgi:ankyrin repeat protein
MILAVPLGFALSLISPVAAQKAIDAEDQDQLTQLMRASAKGDLNAVNSLLAKGADPNVQNTVHGLSALMFASYFGHTAVVDVLVEKGAKITMKDAMGAEPIDWAILGEHPALVKAYSSKGAREHPFLFLGSMPFALMNTAAGK